LSPLVNSIQGRYVIPLRRPSSDKLTLKAGAADVGNALNDLGEGLKQGAGVGIRWRSPIGLIRVDLASGLNKEGNPWRVHVVIGPDL